VSVGIPLSVLTAVTGVSGAGKSILVSQVLAMDPTALESFDRLVLVDQRPIGRAPRSNLATYTGDVRHGAHAVRRNGRGAGPRLRRALLLLQCLRGPPLRDLS